MLKILVIHGPNLLLLGKRETHIYGDMTLDDINRDLLKKADELGCSLDIIQRDDEGSIVSLIGVAQADGLLINPAAYTHTSVAIADAILSMAKPAVEVHLSNIYKRESWRHHSYVAPVVTGQISGLGADGYILGLEFLIKTLSSQERPT
ncbi:type II 3-dehydroquinate dehydratase [PVC group bacterium (ex Bugula neritina AB1)]|nr:type II 3-dehydroquinate dehydratase [PVC group bacterium (ex Bugula neritina AB1)]